MRVEYIVYSRIANSERAERDPGIREPWLHETLTLHNTPAADVERTCNVAMHSGAKGRLHRAHARTRLGAAWVR
jgi:hypothetical protein